MAKCEKCSKAPLSYACPHCGSANFLEKKKDKRHPARIVLALNKGDKSDPSADKAKVHLERKSELEREIEIAALNKRLVQLRSSPEFKLEMSAWEKIKKNYSEHEATAMGVQIFERNERKKYLEEYQDDPEMLEMSNLAMDAFVDMHGLTPKRCATENKKELL